MRYRVIERNNGYFELLHQNPNTQQWIWKMTERSVKKIKKRMAEADKEKMAFATKRIVEEGVLS